MRKKYLWNYLFLAALFVLMLAVEVGLIVFFAMPQGGGYYLSMLPSLGWQPMEEVYNEELGIYQYVMGHQSQLLLLYGVGCVLIIVLAIVFWRYTVRSGYRALNLKKQAKSPIPSCRILSLWQRRTSTNC